MPNEPAGTTTDPSGFNLPGLTRSVLSWPVIAWLISWGSLVLGAFLTVWTSEIRDASKRALIGPRGPADWYVLFFWVAVLLWTYLLYRRLKVDDRHAEETTLELIRAIHRTPNYTVIASYPSYFRFAADAVAAVNGPPGPPDERRTELAAAIQLVLFTVAGMATEFAAADEARSYGANVMLVAKPKPAPNDPFSRELVDALRFFDKKTGNLRSLLGVLYMPQALLLAHQPKRPPRTVPIIALPVPSDAEDQSGHVLALPGAPWALLTGDPVVYPDARRIADDYCGDFTAAVRDEVRAYFGVSGEGRSIGSLMSVRIGDEKLPVGVLNIDSNGTNLLGPEPRYYKTFFALLAPILRLLAGPVSEYARLTADAGEYLYQSPIASSASPASGNGTSLDTSSSGH